MLRKNVLFVLLPALFGLLLTGCGGQTSSEEPSVSSEVQKTISIEDVVLEVNESIDLSTITTFTPADSIDTVTYIIATGGQEIVTINRQGTLTALKAGTTSVTATINNTHVSTSFNVTVTEPSYVDVDYIASFNELGTFENDLDGWTLLGTTASQMSVDVDGDTNRNRTTKALKLWVADYAAASGETPEVSSLIDFTIGTSFTEEDFVSGTYTLSFDIIAEITTVEVTINDTKYTRANEELTVTTGGYNTNYIVFEQTSKDFVFSMYFYGGNGDNNWGYVDNIYLQEGDHKPIEVVVENLLEDPGFEIAGKNGIASSPWILTGTPGVNTWGNNLKFDGNGARSGSYGFNYWHGNAVEDDFTLHQTVTVTTAGNYDLTYFIYGGDYTATNSANTKIFVSQNDTVIKEMAIPVSKAGFTEKMLENIALSEGAVTVTIRIQTTIYDAWIKLDDFVLTLKA